MPKTINPEGLTVYDYIAKAKPQTKKWLENKSKGKTGLRLDNLVINFDAKIKPEKIADLYQAVILDEDGTLFLKFPRRVETDAE